MNLVDKLLLGLLVLLLPMGLLVSFVFFRSPAESSGVVKSAQIDEAKLRELISQTVQQNQTPVTTPKPIMISEVKFASDSGVLQLKGTAPKGGSSVLVSATVIQRTSDEEDDDDRVRGSVVETVSVWPEETGVFEYQYEVARSNYQDLIELRLEQNDSVYTIKFDLREKRQVL